MKKTLKKTIMVISLVFAMTVTVLIPNFSPIGIAASAYDYLSYGIDVSHHNGTIDWNKVAGDNVDFAIIRAGTTAVNGEYLYTDRKFEANYSGAVDSGIKVGAYYYCGAYTEEGFERNAYDFLELLDGKSFDLPVYIDIERASKQKALGKDTLTTYILSALDIISNAGYTAGIYSNRDWFKNYINESRIRESGYEIWWAQYPSGEYAVDPTGYDKSSLCGIWQYSSVGRINGINHNVDLNVAYIDYNYSDASLTAPNINVSVDGQIATVSWNKVKNAERYDVRLYYADGRSLYDHWGGDPDETEVRFKMDPGDYKVQVCSANDSGFVYCDLVYFTIESEPLAAPVLNVSVDGQIATISWNKVNGATHYDVRLYYADGRSLNDHWGGDPDETAIRYKMDPGDYKVQVCSADNNGSYTYCELVYFTVGSENKTFEDYSSVYVSEGTYYFSPKCAPNSCIDSEGGETLSDNYNHNIHLWEYLGNSNQQFSIEYAGEKDGKKLYYIKNTLTKQYVAARGDNVTELPYKLSISKWYFIDCGNGYYKIINYFNDLALDIRGAGSENGTNAWCYDPTDMDNSAQLFKLNNVD